jgi:UDP-glucose 4-epimerase
MTHQDTTTLEDRTVLVTGGAGYVGSHAVLALLEAGCRVIVLDDLSTGHAEGVVRLGAELVEGDVGDRVLLDRIFARQRVAGVLHFAAKTVVPDSVRCPLAYYEANLVNSIRLIERAVEHGVEPFIFSSTAAVYGNPETMPVAETAPTRPINPYGRSKLMVEQCLADAASAHGLRHVVLRYFNVAGADPEGRVGQTTPNATHLIKVACEVALGRRPSFTLFGADYDTPDGTCIRDYIHASDLAAAHVQALRHLLGGGGSRIFNCGYGKGFSVREVLDAVERVGGHRLEVEIAPRRLGDPVRVIADAARIRSEFSWRPHFDELDQIVAHALAFERKWQAMCKNPT